MSLNQVMLIGRLGQDVDLKHTQSGEPIANISIVTDESYTDKNGNHVQRSEWHKVTIFGKQAENCAKYLHKGSLAYIDGSLATRKWQDQQGQDRYITEIKAKRVLFLDSRKNDNKAPKTDSKSVNQDVPF